MIIFVSTHINKYKKGDFAAVLFYFLSVYLSIDHLDFFVKEILTVRSKRRLLPV